MYTKIRIDIIIFKILQIMNTLQLSKCCLLIAVSWTFKLLLIPGYYSTDFQVHQNWLRITYNLPLSEWYYNSDSVWTLDYPPLFAYFEYILACISVIIDPTISATINQNNSTILYQRITVIATDLSYLFALLYYWKWQITSKLVILYFFIPFIILDNIHFQYNIMLQALFVMSVCMMKQKRYLFSAFLYSTLLNMKHIYLYCAPAFFIYLLFEYVNNHNQKNEIINENGGIRGQQSYQKLRRQEQHQENRLLHKFRRLCKLAFVTLVPFIISFGPFLCVSGIAGITQIMSRLFPFGRGLIHDFWAPNIWALYHCIDKILNIIMKKLGRLSAVNSVSLVTDASVNTLKVLPQISPSTTILLILIFLTPLILKTIHTVYKQNNFNQKSQRNRKKSVNFESLVCICGLVFFTFGYHVHEKAITPYLALIFMFFNNVNFIGAAIFINIVNLIPLLISPAEKILAIIFCALWQGIWDLYSPKKENEFNFALPSNVLATDFSSIIFSFFRHITFQSTLQDIISISGWIMVLYYCVIQIFIKNASLEFLPLMLNSVWAATFNLCWVSYLYWKFIRNGTIDDNSNQ